MFTHVIHHKYSPCQNTLFLVFILYNMKLNAIISYCYGFLKFYLFLELKATHGGISFVIKFLAASTLEFFAILFKTIKTILIKRLL